MNVQTCGQMGIVHYVYTVIETEDVSRKVKMSHKTILCKLNSKMLHASPPVPRILETPE